MPFHVKLWGTKLLHEHPTEGEHGITMTSAGSQHSLPSWHWGPAGGWRQWVCVLLLGRGRAPSPQTSLRKPMS